MEHIVFLKLEEFSCNKKKDAASILQFIASLIITWLESWCLHVHIMFSFSSLFICELWFLHEIGTQILENKNNVVPWFDFQLPFYIKKK